MKIIKNIFFVVKILLKCFYAFFAFLITCVELLEIFSAFFSSIYRSWFDVSQVAIAILLELFLLFLLWYILFSKRNFFVKALLFVLLFYSPFLFRKIDFPDHRSHIFDFDYCLEDGECEEGRKIIVNGKKEIVVSKQTCAEYKWKWYEESKICKLRYNGNDSDIKLKPRAYELDKKECIKEGYCWDSQRNFCESKEEQYCIDNKKECENKNGTWDKFFKVCKINQKPNRTTL